MKNLAQPRGIDGISTVMIMAFLTVVINSEAKENAGSNSAKLIAKDLFTNTLSASDKDGPLNVSIAGSKEVSMIGNWPRLSGDGDMDTDAGDYVPVRCSTNIYIDGNKIVLKVFFRIEEYGNDHTIYSGAKTMVIFENTRPGYVIKTVELNGPRLNNYLVYSDGRNYDFRNFETADSYWDYLQYRIDGPGDDTDTIGIKGSLKFNVILELLPSGAAVSIGQT